MFFSQKNTARCFAKRSKASSPTRRFAKVARTSKLSARKEKHLRHSLTDLICQRELQPAMHLIKMRPVLAWVMLKCSDQPKQSTFNMEKKVGLKAECNLVIWNTVYAQTTVSSQNVGRDFLLGVFPTDISFRAFRSLLAYACYCAELRFGKNIRLWQTRVSGPHLLTMDSRGLIKSQVATKLSTDHLQIREGRTVPGTQPHREGWKFGRFAEAVCGRGETGGG